jgi:hypothetical protein
MRTTKRRPAWAGQRAAQERYDREQAFQARVGELMALDEGGPAVMPAIVGWAIFPAGGTAAGLQHVCIQCSPARPGLSFTQVHSCRLAATRCCTRCGRRLETVT